MRARQHRAVAAVLVAVAMVAVAGCGGDDDESTTTTSEADDGPTTLAKGEDVELVGDDGLGGQTLNIIAEEEDGEVTGEFRVTNVVVTIQCADTNTDGEIILGGEVTEDPGGDVAVGDLLALIIREGDPDLVALLANDNHAESCTELLAVAFNLDPGDFVAVEDGSDIETSLTGSSSSS